MTNDDYHLQHLSQQIADAVVQLEQDAEALIEAMRLTNTATSDFLKTATISLQAVEEALQAFIDAARHGSEPRH